MRTLKGKRVLIIDDDPSVRDILAMMIKDLGGSVHTCNSGEDAIALTARNFDSVLLDMRMRGLSGQATYEQLAPELQSKVIFVTGDALNSVARKFIDSTSRPVLIKPVSVAKLSEAIAKVGAN
jgi:CheY-like chemotaxis protein